MEQITVSDIESKIQERMKDLEDTHQFTRLDELKMLMDWILCGDEY